MTIIAQPNSPANGETQTIAIEGPHFSVAMRGMHEPRKRARIFHAATAREALRQALAAQNHSALEPILEWEGVDTLAALDVDFHTIRLEQRPKETYLENLVRRVSPKPIFSWRTHGRGLRLVYW